ncbi:MAG: HAMP domain-containing protein [Anaerolineae bacterium]|nr:HAMP domain-containing protein [Anaerolineae bacterium]
MRSILRFKQVSIRARLMMTLGVLLAGLFLAAVLAVMTLDAAQSDREEQVTQAQGGILAVLLGFGGVSALLLWSNTNAITSGLETLNEGTQKLVHRPQDTPIQFPPERRDEFVQLGEAINRMAQIIRTTQQQLERVESALASAENATERKTNFIANMSHELRAPMHIIMNFTRLMLDGELGQLNDLQKMSMNNVFNAATHLLAVINDVLDLAKIEAGELDIRIQELDLKPILLEMESSAQGLMGDKSLFFRIVGLENLLPVKADPVRVRQILLNLIANAIRFTDAGGVTLRVGRIDQMLEICVEDTGTGISPEKQEVIFERFQQETGSRGGTGLGLTITRDLVHLQGGKIYVASTPGQGSTFCFTLPLLS